MEEEETKKREATWKTMKYSFIGFGASFGLLGGYMIYQLGMMNNKNDNLKILMLFAVKE